MGYALRLGLSYCEAGDRLVFLDLEGDRYFHLLPDLERAFRSVAESRESSEPLAAALVERGILRMIEGEREVHPVQHRSPTDSAETIGNGSTTAAEVVRALRSEARVFRQIRSGGMASIIASLRPSAGGNSLSTRVTDRRPASTIRAFEVAKLFRSPANRCLSRSIAMIHRLAQCGFFAQLVLGVRAAPFAAHSWVQAGDLVLNDSVEEVSRFSPILVV